MSMEAITKVFKNSKTDGNALLILLSLADWCDQDFSCFPSIKRIAEKARVSEPTAKRYMRAFMKMGLITKEAREDSSGRQTSNRYYLNVEMIGSDEVTKEILDSVTYDSQRQEWEGVTGVSGGEGVSGLTGGGGKSIYRGVGVSGLTGAIMNHQKEPLNEPSSDSATAPSFSGELPLTDYVNGADAQAGKANALDSLPPNTANARTTPESQKSPPRKRKSNLVDDAFIAELKRLNPNKDVDAQIAPAKSWLLARPGRQFTKAYFSSWINRTKETEQEEIWKPRVI